MQVEALLRTPRPISRTNGFPRSTLIELVVPPDPLSLLGPLDLPCGLAFMLAGRRVRHCFRVQLRLWRAALIHGVMDNVANWLNA